MSKVHEKTPPRLLRKQKILNELYDVSSSTFDRQVASGIFPPPIKIGRCNLWRLSDVEKFINGLESVQA